MSAPRPYYSDNAVTLYHGDARHVLPRLCANASGALLLTDPPYPNRAGHFVDDVPAGAEVVRALTAPHNGLARAMVFWHQLAGPDAGLPLVARHAWHRTNTNRPDNYEAIYEFASDGERPSRVFPFPVVYPGLTGCVEATGHPTQKPVDLMQSLIRLRPAPARVLDPFAGSGATLVAAYNLGLPCVGVEKNERYCEDIARRLSQGVLDLGGAA